MVSSCCGADWASETRILCGLHAPCEAHGVVVSKTRLVGADADGKNVKVLMEVEDAPGTTLLGRILAWDIPGRPNTVLMLANSAAPSSYRINGMGSRWPTPLPSVYALDAVTGDFKMEMRPHPPLTSYLMDTHGEPALGWGRCARRATRSTTSATRRRTSGARWPRFPGTLKPVALCAPAMNCAYALGDSDGHTALWRIDLSGKEKPVVEFALPSADLDTPLLARDGHLFGVRYDTSEPMVYYTDSTAGADH